MKVLHCIGNRPQYMKLAPLIWSSPLSVDNYIVNTGQHYDPEMSSDFINEFKLPNPDWTLTPPKQDLGLQFLMMIQQIDEIFMDQKFDFAFVYGDTNSTLAAAISANNHNVPIAHIESGLRSRDFNMPEERNRIIVDSYSKLKLTPTLGALENLKKENLQDGSFFVGDLMLDLFKKSISDVEDSHVIGDYLLCTIHRKSNLEEKRIQEIMKILSTSQKKIKLVVHPALKVALNNSNLNSLSTNIEKIQPQSYLSTLCLLKNANGVITDSGGLQKEAYWMGKPTLIPRSSTEWSETIDENFIHLDHKLDKLNTFTEAENKIKPDFLVFGDGLSAQKIWDIIQN